MTSYPLVIGGNATLLYEPGTPLSRCNAHPLRFTPDQPEYDHAYQIGWFLESHVTLDPHHRGPDVGAVSKLSILPNPSHLI